MNIGYLGFVRLATSHAQQIVSIWQRPYLSRQSMLPLPYHLPAPRPAGTAHSWALFKAKQAIFCLPHPQEHLNANSGRASWGRQLPGKSGALGREPGEAESKCQSPGIIWKPHCHLHPQHQTERGPGPHSSRHTQPWRYFPGHPLLFCLVFATTFHRDITHCSQHACYLCVHAAKKAWGAKQEIYLSEWWTHSHHLCAYVWSLAH